LNNEEVKAAIAFSAIAIANTSPFTPGTAYDLFYMMAAETRGIKKAWGFARGGMGSITSALAGAARSFGVEIRTGCAVDKVIVKNGKVVGVALSDGTEIRGRVVISNADPKNTFLKLVPRGCLDSSFIEQVAGIRMAGTSSVVHLLLDRLPQISGFPNSSSAGVQHRGMIVIAPSLEYLDAAWHDAAEGKISTRPILTMSMQSVTDDSIAPPGKHLLSIFVQFTPYSLSGMDWESGRDQLFERVIGTIEGYMPNIRDVLDDYVVLSPPDLESRFGITGGHAEHGDMNLDQLFENRPVRGWAHYRTPVQNLYLCGAGSHPGGTVTGAPGFNAAQIVLSDFRSNLATRGGY
jgi:phytoene dehydrogenase-like protein